MLLGPTEEGASVRTKGPLKLDRAAQLKAMLASGQCRNRAEPARAVGISRARVTQILGPASEGGFGLGR